jgi:hypothetical protein
LELSVSLHRSTSVSLAAVIAALSLAPARAAESDRAAQLHDIEVVRGQYLAKEMAYTPATRAMAGALLDDLARRAGSLTPIQFMVEIAKVGALTDNTHSGARRNDPRVETTARLPLRLLWMPDGLIVARAAGADSDLAGARVLRIEGRSPEAVYAGAKVLLGGAEAGRKHWLNGWIESEGVLNALGLAKSADAVSMTLRLRDGHTVERVVPMRPVAETGPSAELGRLWSPEPVHDEKGWTPALKIDQAPLYLRDADRPFRTEPLPALHALSVQFRWNQDDEGFPIAAFLRSVEQSISTERPQNLVVDLRFDEGGNLLTTLDFMRGLARRVPGRTYLLVGPYTFSAGIISAAALKQGGGDRVTIVGAPVGDRAHFWSEGGLIDLPNSHLSVRYTNGQFNLRDGCTGEPACMDDMYKISVNFVSLDPDIPAPLTTEAYLAGRDPGLEAVSVDIRRARR